MQGKITAIETGGRNDFGTNDAIILDPLGVAEPERCQVCGEVAPPEKVSSTTISSRSRSKTWVFACRECRIAMEKLAHNLAGGECPNCDGSIDPYAPNRYICFTGHEDFSRTPQIEICEPCFGGYEEL